MSDFEDRLIEDLGHEISDVVMAGEELLRAPKNESEPFQFAHEFRSLLRTLEVGIRLLQWNEFANFLSDLGLKFDAAFVLEEPAEVVRQKMEKTVQLLLTIYEGFDGVRFSADQLSAWAENIHQIWESPEDTAVEVDHSIPLEDSELLAKDFTSVPTSPSVSRAPMVGIQVASSPTKIEFLAIEFLGQEFLFPMDRVLAMASVDRHQILEWRNQMQSPGHFQFRGQEYRPSKLMNFRNQKKGSSANHSLQGAEFIFIKGLDGLEMLEVDRVIGFRKTDSEDFTVEQKPQGGFCRLKNRGHLSSRWLFSPTAA